MRTGRLARSIAIDQDPESRRWRMRRRIYRAGRWALFFAIAGYFGPNLILFQRLTRPTLADAVQEIQRDYVPTVVAIKTYQRDNGQLPTTLDDLVPRYLNVVPKGQYFSNGVLSCDSKLCRIDCMRYIITPDHEGWISYSQIIRGDLKLPPVTLDPAPTQPIPPQ